MAMVAAAIGAWSVAAAGGAAYLTAVLGRVAPAERPRPGSGRTPWHIHVSISPVRVASGRVPCPSSTGHAELEGSADCVVLYGRSLTLAAVVVIGAGVGGLAAAARLAALGHRVRVVERAATAGGKLGRLVQHTECGTFRFDTGPSLLTLPQVFADLFAATGSTLDGEVDLVRLDPIVRHVFPDGAVLDTCSDPASMAERIENLCGTRAAGDWAPTVAACRSASSRRRGGTYCSPLWTRYSPPHALAWRLPALATIAPGRTLRGLAGRT
jgi:hypothetical protein